MLYSNFSMTALFSKTRSIDGIKKLKKISDSTLMILEEAEKHGITWKKLPYTDRFQLNYKGDVQYFHGQIPSKTTAFAYTTCKNKRLTNNILSEAGIAVSKGYLIKHRAKKEVRIKLYNGLQKPLVVKPVDDLRGNNVCLNIRSQSEYERVISKIYAFNGRRKVDLLVEEMFAGVEYRILATQEKILSVIKRLSPNVVGDGKKNIQELIAEKNKDPIRQEISTYSQVSVDVEVLGFLAEQSLSLATVPKKDKRIFLRDHSASDITFGGDTVDETNEIHPSVKKNVSTLMHSIPGLALAGIDYMTEDITQPQTREKYRVIEINASPSLDWNAVPLQGKRRNIALDFLRIMFPKLRSV